MDLFALLGQYDYGAVHMGRDPATGMQCIVAIHDTRLGPAIGAADSSNTTTTARPWWTRCGWRGV